MEELLKYLLEEKRKREKEVEKNFRSAEELGLRRGDLVICKDGESVYIDNPEDVMIKFKNIAEVKRPVEWEEVEIKRPKRIGKTRSKKEDK